MRGTVVPGGLGREAGLGPPLEADGEVGRAAVQGEDEGRLARAVVHPDDGPPEIEAPRPFNERQFVPNFREMTRNAKVEMTAHDLELSEGQTNYDALHALESLCEEKGAELWVLFLPSSPEYYERFERGQFSQDFHSHMRGAFTRYVRMSPLPQDHYTDYKHANLLGRPILTRQLAHLMARTPFGKPQPIAPSSPPTGER